MAERKRISAVASLDEQETYAASLADPIDVEAVKVQLELLDSYYASFVEAQSKIEEKCKAEEITKEIQEKSKFMNKYVKVKATLKNALSKLNVSVPTTHVPNAQLHLKLPDVNLPDFHGSYTEWPSFLDQFNSMVHDRADLSGVRK